MYQDSKECETGQEEDICCSICLSIFYQPIFLQKCKHIFCSPCIQEATELVEMKKCPLCRTPFKQGDKIRMLKLEQHIQTNYPQQLKLRMASLQRLRYYRVEVGNTTEVIDTTAKNKYRWTLFIRPAFDEENLDKFIDHVDIKLHSSFHPSELTIKPMKNADQIRLKKVGWGTFNIKMKIYWKKQFGNFTEISHELAFEPHVSKVVTCKLEPVEQ